MVAIYDVDPNTEPEEKIESPNSSIIVQDRFQGDRIGSVRLENDGSFELSYDDTEYRIRNPTEKRPDLFLMVLGPEDADSESPPKILFSSKLLRQNSGRIESYFIRISSQQLKEVGINPPNEENESSDKKIQNYIKEKDAKFVLNEGIAKYNKTIADVRLTERKSFKTKFKNLIATNIDNFQGNGVFVKDGEDVFEKTAEVINEGVKNANEKLGSPDSGVPINLYLTPKDRKNLKTFFDNAVNGIAEIPESFIRPLLFRASSSENVGTLLINNNPIAKFCRDKSVEETCAKAHLGDTPDHHHDGNNENGNGNGEGNGDGNITGPNVTNITSADIPTYVAKLISDIRSPDYVMNPDKIQSRPNQDLITKSVNSLSLARGPANAPAYHDFHSLQIAFDYVWKQLFDEDIIDLGYNLHTKVLQRTGINPIMQNMLSSVRLKSLATIIFDTPIAQMSANVAAHFDITKEEWNDLDFSLRAKLEEIAQSLTDGFKVKDKYYQELHEQGERLIDSVRHDDYYTMHKTLRDLHERLNSNYEYTIFAADNDHCSVNFGLLNTFRQKWLPLNYQVGKLCKTIPLAPKEERKYSLKITKHFKRTEKEARKNNTSFTNEQTTTSRSEAEIIAKAQNKTNFNLSAEGTYNIGVNKYDVKTSLGIDAQNESQQSRKDFREAVLKATQEYKDERSTEINTEVSVDSEYNDSGTILNPSDESAVAFLFYELESCFLISEELYRVLPAVLVAQPVPKPHEITEAWVIAHDWILNRFLLDDSFAPSLVYLANKSVGDDFALRELRRNLRQQRSLVETLKTELASASAAAENKYLALLDKIDKKIKEEE